MFAMFLFLVIKFQPHKIKWNVKITIKYNKNGLKIGFA